MIEFISQLPTEYQEVEYLENSGTQYIVVDFIPNQDTRLDMLAEPRSVVAAASGVGFIPYGSGVDYNSNAFECYTYDTGKLEFNYAGQYKTDAANISVGTKINISHNKNNIVVTDTNGQTIARHSFNYMAFTCPRNLTLFAINRSTALVGQTRIYSCQIYNDTTLALDLVPCYRKSDRTAGLYDLSNNVFYTNAGSGVFAVGADSNKRAVVTITPGGVISFGAALRRRMMGKNSVSQWTLTVTPNSLYLTVSINGENLAKGTYVVDDGTVVHFEAKGATSNTITLDGATVASAGSGNVAQYDLVMHANYTAQSTYMGFVAKWEITTQP